MSSVEWMQQKEAEVMQIWVGPTEILGTFETIGFIESFFTVYYLDCKSTVEIVKYANVKRCRNVLLLTTALKRKVSPFK